MSIVSVNPATEEVVERFAEHGDDELEAKLALAARAYREHRSGSLAQRAAGMTRAAALLEQDKGKLARVVVEEMGKPIRAAVAEIEKCALCCRHYAEHAQEYLDDQPLPSDFSDAYVRHLPLGPVLAIMPWNFPFWQVFRFAAPALMAGNVGLLKHATSVPRCALAIEDVLRRAGFPDGVFQSLFVSNERVRSVIEDPRVMAVTLTGSERAGEAVASAAGGKLKKAVLELGGSDPFIVMPSADLDVAVDVAVNARHVNAGQSCIAAKRFLVHRDVYADVERRFVEAVRRLRVGDPMSEETDVGPLASASGRDAIERQLKESVAAGARLAHGGKRWGERGFFFEPAVLVDVPTESPAHRQELFGPVSPLFPVRDLEHAIRLANDSVFGLGSSVWTTDAAEQERFIDELEAGQTFVNAMVASDPRLPFGGIKRSGYGRELSAIGMYEFMNAKTVCIEREPRRGQKTQTE